MDSKSQIGANDLAPDEPIRFRVRSIALVGLLPMLTLCGLAVTTGAGYPWTIVALGLCTAFVIAITVRWLRVGIDIHSGHATFHYVRKSETVAFADLRIESHPVPERFARARRPAVMIPALSHATTGAKIRLPIPVSRVALERAIATMSGVPQPDEHESTMDRLVGATSTPSTRATAIRAALR